jgi:endogenous inhibitor of DNA gyrase (YacG/DUF329 family)
MNCAQCDTEIEQSPTSLVQDYLCARCRVNLDPTEWDERDRVMAAVQEWLRSRGKIYYGHEIMYPKDSPWAWIKVYQDADTVEALLGQAAHDARSYDTFLNRYKVKWYHVWKHSGCVYETEPDGSIGDDPLFVPSFA